MTELNIPPSRLAEAFEFANWIHGDQYRKQAPGEDPNLRVKYLTHLVEVLAIVIQGHGTENQQIAALLHDAIEDQPITPDGRVTEEVIKAKFGIEVLGLVLACTDGTPGGVRDESNWKERKQKHINHLRVLFTKNPDVALVAIADKLSNSLAIVNDILNNGPKVWKRFRVGPDLQSWYYQETLALLKDHFGEEHHLVKRLDRQVAQLSKLASDVVAVAG